MGFNYNGIGKYQPRFTSTDDTVVSVIGTTEPVTLAEAKNYLRLNNTQDDDLITSLIENARLDAEKYLNSDIVSKQRTTYYNYLDTPVNLKYAPINSVDTVTIDGETHTVEEGYTVNGLDNPKVDVTGTDIQITYTTTGITDGSIKIGILALIAWKYYQRGASEKGINTNWKSFLSPYRVFGFYGQR